MIAAIGPDKINGLPAHVLLLHVVVVLVPLTAVCLLASAWWPAARRRLGVVTPLLALIVLVFVPITVSAGEWLLAHLGGESPLLARHARLGHGLLPWAIALFVVSVLVWAWHRFGASRPAEPDAEAPPSGSGGTAVLTRRSAVSTRQSVAIGVVLAVLATVIAVGSVVDVYRIGDSGAKAVWSGTAQG